MADKSGHNPSGSDEVEEGWKKNQEYNRRRKEEEEAEKNKDPNFEVNKSGPKGANRRYH
jgi:hypothetical protein